jgi:hypothetical protein
MNEMSICNARRAEVPIGALQALVANAIDVLITSIADSVMTNITAWSKKSLGYHIKLGIFNCWRKGMLGMMAMIHADMARNAKIKVWASSASNEILFGEFLDAGVASASRNMDLEVFCDGWDGLWLLLDLTLWRNGFRNAVNN